MRLRVTVSKTAQGDLDYLQIMSDDLVSVNVVLVADAIDVLDVRQKRRPAPRSDPPKVRTPG